MNPILNKIGIANQGIQRIRQAYQMAKVMSSPEEAIKQVAQENPQMLQVIEMVKNNGGDAKSLFYSLAEEKGVNPDDVLNMLK